MNGISIHLTGVVQGVGFRPWVWRTATALGLSGSVSNRFDGVRIELYGSDCRAFLEVLEREPPPLSRIDAVHAEEIPFRSMEGFRILESETAGDALQRIAPDTAPCDACRRELFDPSGRRYRHPFINCVDCGPRFSIIEGLPYDRSLTTMRTFDMCTACAKEYADPADRRYHAQPVACPECGPRIEPENWEMAWCEAMERGRIVAVKGIGGFHLACAAQNAEAVATLRRRKGRESKPFACMVPNLEWVKSICALSAAEERLLQSRERPIVLLKTKRTFPSLEFLAPGLDTLGIMLPYSPMHELMFDRYPHPVVMTSANHTAEPMIHTNAAAAERLAGIADRFILHNRAIANRCEDSVCAVHGGQTIVLRPGRGIAPLSMPEASGRTILAFGADMKNCPALAHHGQVTLLPYVGDLEHPEAQHILHSAVERELACFHVVPEQVVHDLHPDYFSTQIAERFAATHGIPSVGVQHHHAHLAGAHPGPAIGFAFDGTGYGTDGSIWGGEVLVYTTSGFERAFHLRPFALPGGEAAIRHPERVADALLHQLDPERIDNPATRVQLASGLNCPSTSSMGRLFDAVACLLGVCGDPTYDGEAAMRLEAVADGSECGDLAFGIRDGQIDWRPLVADLLDELAKGIPAGILAARFHNTLAEIVFCCGRLLTERHGRLPWVFAGGVFQNRLLVDRIKRVVDGAYELVFSSLPNDSGLALGQIRIGAEPWASR